jgi:hypothetical protein
MTWSLCGSANHPAFPMRDGGLYPRRIAKEQLGFRFGRDVESKPSFALLQRKKPRRVRPGL